MALSREAQLSREQPLRRETGTRSRREWSLAGIVAIVVIIGVGAFVWNTFAGFGDRTGAGRRPPAVTGPVTLWLSAERVPPGGAEVIAILVDHEGIEATFGVHAIVDAWDGREWVPHGELVMCMDHWHCTARIEPPGEIDAVPALGLQARPGTPGPVERFSTAGLDPGWYRVSQTANEGVVAKGVFEVAADADPPIRLWSVDVPAISVAPALLAAPGGVVYLYPLVPSGADGSLSREDMLGAVESLSDEARLERWDGTTWEAVTTVDLVPVPGDSLPRSATIPRLEAGAYRLVRSGSDRPHIGQFWVDESN